MIEIELGKKHRIRYFQATEEEWSLLVVLTPLLVRSF